MGSKTNMNTNAQFGMCALILTRHTIGHSLSLPLHLSLSHTHACARFKISSWWPQKQEELPARYTNSKSTQHRDKRGGAFVMMITSGTGPAMMQASTLYVRLYTSLSSKHSANCNVLAHTRPAAMHLSQQACTRTHPHWSVASLCFAGHVKAGVAARWRPNSGQFSSFHWLLIVWLKVIRQSFLTSTSSCGPSTACVSWDVRANPTKGHSHMRVYLSVKSDFFQITKVKGQIKEISWHGRKRRALPARNIR